VPSLKYPIRLVGLSKSSAPAAYAGRPSLSFVLYIGQQAQSEAGNQSLPRISPVIVQPECTTTCFESSVVVQRHDMKYEPLALS
jgi:hypothetical protein